MAGSDRAEQRAPLFLETRGADKEIALTLRVLQKLIRKYADDAKIEGITPHRWRLTFSRRYFDKSGDPVIVNPLLGHRRQQTTAIYAQPSLDEMIEAFEQQIDAASVSLLSLRSR